MPDRSYGHIAPITSKGRAATIVYAIFGIPLMLLYLANIGGTLAKSFRYLYGRFQACVNNKKQAAASSARSRSSRSRSRPRRAVTYRYNSIPLRTPRTVQSVPSSPVSRNPRNAIEIRDSSSADIERGKYNTGRGVGYRLDKSMTEPNMQSDSHGSRSMRDIDIRGDSRRRSITTGTGSGGGTGSSSYAQVHVPIMLCLIILIAYVSIGGILFSGWESWEVHDGIYFCFITLSTIGLGDMVPGEKSLESKNMILCALYILIGLALIAMCFNLMQEGVIHKVKTLGKLIGIIKSRGDEDEDEEEEDEMDGDEDEEEEEEEGEGEEEESDV
ncbi:potassium channel subfamily K member 18-like isoform X2 [Brevipalpus obovatus]|uniref:potassium channel subfamily K member 18-like isoform X2 n=1 Tax=Brevipalpus obovatus TaxID=246614 RepID=UPI003D9F6AB1